MKIAGRLTRARTLTLAPFALLLAGCAGDLYLSESDVAAFAANLETSQRANNLFDDLQGQVLDVRLAVSPSGGHVIRNANTLALLRSSEELAFIADAFQQIRLEPFAGQLEDQLLEWLDEQTAMLERRGGTRIDIKRIDRLSVGIVTAPVFAHDVASQTIRFELTVSPSIHLRLAHNFVAGDLPPGLTGIVGGFFGTSDVIQGEHDYTLRVRDLPVAVELRLSRPFRDASLIDVSIAPDVQSANVQVSGSAPQELRDGIRDVLIRILGQEQRESHALQFRDFAIANLGLVSGTDGDTALNYRYVSRHVPASAALDIVMRGNDRKLYHARRVDGAFTEAAALPLAVETTADPALVASSPGRLDLLVVTRDGDLVHAVRQHGRWDARWRAGADGIARRFATDSRAGLLATAPGQLEAVLADDGGALVHLRRKNGEWLPPQVLGELSQRADGALRDPVLLQVGFKLVLLCRDDSRGLYGMVFDMEAGLWGQPTQLGTDLAQAPGAALLDDWNVGVAWTTRDGNVVYRRLGISTEPFRPDVAMSGLSYGPEVVVGQDMDGPPEFVATGFNAAALAVRGRDRRLKINHLFANGWRGWTDADGAFFGTPANGNVGAEFAMASTAAGELHWVGKRGDGRSRVLYNQHPGFAATAAEPGGVTPRHWRGFQDVSRARFVGRPAVAATSRTAAVVVVDAGNVPWTGVVGDARPVTLRSLTETVTFGTDPQVVSSHAGQIDTVFVGEDGQLRYVRRVGDRVQVMPTPPMPALLGAVAVTARANQLDVVALGINRSLYYLRFARGSWQGIVGFGTDIISAPAVVDTGAGQLEIFAVDASRRLNRFRLVDGQLSGPDYLPVSFPLSAALFGQRNAASWGDGRVDVVVSEDQTGALHHARFEPGRLAPVHPAGAVSLMPVVAIGASAADRPALVAQSERRLDVVTATGSGWIEHALFSTTRGGTAPAQPAATGVGPRRIAATPSSPLRLGPGARASEATWKHATPIFERPGLFASATMLADGEFVVPVCSRSGNLLLRRYRGGRWEPPTPVFGTLATLPDDRPCRVVSATY